MKKYKYHDNNSYATLPGDLAIDWNKLKIFKRELNIFERFSRMPHYPGAMIAEHLQCGCCNSALVVQTEPDVIVAAYSDDHDWAVLLRFSPFFRENYSLRPGSKLVTVNTYFFDPRMAEDLEEGPRSTHNFSNYYPIIAEFCSSDYETIERKKQQIEIKDWQRIEQLAPELIANPRLVPRNGSPYYSAKPQPLRQGYLT